MKKVNFGVVAAVIGLMFAVGTQEAASKSFDPEYARQANGNWILVTPTTEANNECLVSNEPCKATFPQDPNVSQSGMVITSDNGVYTPL